MLRCRFFVNIDECNDDFRPVIWPIKYPYWCTGENEEDFVIVAYADSIDDIIKQWPEAHDIESKEVKEIKFTSRFYKPDWYTPDKELAEKVTEEGKKIIRECEKKLNINLDDDL